MLKNHGKPQPSNSMSTMTPKRKTKEERIANLKSLLKDEQARLAELMTALRNHSERINELDEDVEHSQLQAIRALHNELYDDVIACEMGIEDIKTHLLVLESTPL